MGASTQPNHTHRSSPIASPVMKRSISKRSLTIGQPTVLKRTKTMRGMAVPPTRSRGGGGTKQETGPVPTAEQDDQEICDSGADDDGASECAGDEGNGDEGNGEEEFAGDEVAGDEVAGDEVAGDEVVGDDSVGDEVVKDEVAGDEVTGDEVAGDEVAGDVVAGDGVAGDVVAGDEVADAPVPKSEEEISTTTRTEEQKSRYMDYDDIDDNDDIGSQIVFSPDDNGGISTVPLTGLHSVRPTVDLNRSVSSAPDYYRNIDPYKVVFAIKTFENSKHPGAAAGMKVLPPGSDPDAPMNKELRFYPHFMHVSAQAMHPYGDWGNESARSFKFNDEQRNDPTCYHFSLYLTERAWQVNKVTARGMNPHAQDMFRWMKVIYSRAQEWVVDRYLKSEELVASGGRSLVVPFGQDCREFDRFHDEVYKNVEVPGKSKRDYILEKIALKFRPLFGSADEEKRAAQAQHGDIRSFRCKAPMFKQVYPPEMSRGPGKFIRDNPQLLNIWHDKEKKYNRIDVRDASQKGSPILSHGAQTMEKSNVAAPYLIFQMTNGSGQHPPGASFRMERDVYKMGSLKVSVNEEDARKNTGVKSVPPECGVIPTDPSLMQSNPYQDDIWSQKGLADAQLLISNQP